MNIASIDIGSNSVILLVAEVNRPHNRFVPLLNLYSTPRISRNLLPGMPFDPAAVERLKSVLRDFKWAAEENNAELILAGATQAFRKASNGAELVKEIEEEIGIGIRILSGKEEALLSYFGSVSEWEDYSGFMIDIGGGSSEIFLGNKEGLIFSHSYNFGAVSICEQFGTIPPLNKTRISIIKNYVIDTIKENTTPPLHKLPSIAVAGTPTTLACMQLGIKDFDENKIEGFELTYENIIGLNKKMMEMSPEEILNRYGSIVEGREDIILTGSVILETLMELLSLEFVYVSARGLRHGLIYNYLHTII